MSSPTERQWRVVKYGTDSSGRPIYMTWYHRRWLRGRIKKIGFTPTIVQGGFMARVAGGGAQASSGFHDKAGCCDLRVWDLTEAQQAAVVHEWRSEGAPIWHRDAQHGGFDPHMHYVLACDKPLSSGAAEQVRDYRYNLDGLASRGRDYEWRPTPLVLTPSTPPFSMVMGPGARGSDVRAVQRGLVRRGYKVTVTGVMDKATVAAVRKWKTRHGFLPTGTVGARAYWRIAPA